MGARRHLLASLEDDRSPYHTLSVTMTKFDYNDAVRITVGRHAGRTGVIVSLPTPPCDTYTVEFEDGSDADVVEEQSLLLARPTGDLLR